MNITLTIVDMDGGLRATASGNAEVNLVFRGQYEPGDRIRLRLSEPGYLVLSFDAAICPALLYVRETEYDYSLPLGLEGKTFSPVAFAGSVHRLHARQATEAEVAARRNLALNPLDNHANTVVYPHASANVETRGEAAFAARNAIDGEKATQGHGKWPFTSWGINQDPSAELMIDFGRTVEVDQLKLYLRADFPHDAWWERALVTFSDGSTTELQLTKSAEGQSFSLPSRRIEWLRLHDLVKADDPSPFPALTQIEVWGTG